MLFSMMHLGISWLAEISVPSIPITAHRCGPNGLDYWWLCPIRELIMDHGTEFGGYRVL